MPFNFFQHVLQVNTGGYIVVLELFVKPWMTLNTMMCFNRILHQLTKLWWSNIGWGCNFHIIPNMCFPNSPDLNCFDCYMWGIVEQENDKLSHSMTYSQKAAITRAMSNINTDHMIRTCQLLCSCFEATINQVIQPILWTKFCNNKISCLLDVFVSLMVFNVSLNTRASL